MKITNAEYIISAVSPKQYPDADEPEIALVGRSNVGKSSLINKFLKRRNLARTSGQPGKTRALNFYHINDAWYFVDLPGYGYAKISKEIRNTWGKFINEYLTKRPQLVGIVMTVDIRHVPSEDDVTMFGWLEQCGVPFIIIATKADKIPRGHWPRNKKAIAQKLKPSSVDLPVIVASALDGMGIDEFTVWVEERLRSYDSE
ncbi:MAG: YihA family ribosome biogenesis GTP-binding protein [Firmicutes bacterium HGW-Firmicutes-12]|jgi:GTP-binding protein|nr:MAG: YihA family ribosome biogenesis GTP-binding protein [Firmicutes bacterium HGW-Firmicutes-12]